MERGQQTRGFVLQWGNRKRLRCVKIQVQSGGGGSAKKGTTVRVDRRVVRNERDPPASTTTALRRASHTHRVLRNSEATAAMRNPQMKVNGLSTRMMSPERGCHKKGDEEGNKGPSPDSPSMWPKFEIALSNKEKEEDFMIFKGCNKLPQRPKKRAKCIQRTVNLVCPGTWLCDLTHERYEVREKKVSKKRLRGLKAMGSMESDSD